MPASASLLPVSDDANPFERVAGSWDAVMADLEATAAAYREAGWEALELHPGDAVAVSEYPGLDVLVPDEEFDRLEELAAEGSFESYEVYRSDDSGIVFLLVAVEDAARERAVCCPAYYDPTRAEDLGERARAAGEFAVHVRPLADDRGVTFTCEDPLLFFPD